jgi:hypothetical protein
MAFLKPTMASCAASIGCIGARGRMQPVLHRSGATWSVQRQGQLGRPQFSAAQEGDV